MDGPYRSTDLLRRGMRRLGSDPFARLGEGTRYQQPALFLACAAAWETAAPDAEPVAAAGHSLGEYAALYAAGALAFDDAVDLVAERGAAMADADADAPGGMIALLGGDPAQVRALAASHDLTVANDNAPGQLVLSGALDALDAVPDAAGEIGARARRLDVAGAFHSPLMAPAADRLRAALARTPVSEPRFAVYSGASAAPFADVRAELADALLQPVRWRETVLAMHAAGARDFVEVGPGRVLSGMVKRILRAAPQEVSAS